MTSGCWHECVSEVGAVAWPEGVFGDGSAMDVVKTFENLRNVYVPKERIRKRVKVLRICHVTHHAKNKKKVIKCL